MEEQFGYFLEILNQNRYPKLYEYLECSPDSSPSTIKEQYRNLSRIYHPDRGGSNERMVQINEAYEVLSDTQKRWIYNSYGTSSVIPWALPFYSSNILKMISPYFSIFLRSFIVYKSNIKDLSLTCATEGSTKGYNKLEFKYVVGFPIVHHIVESLVSKLLDGDYKSDSEYEDLKLFSKDFLADVVATIVASPIEFLALNKFVNKTGINPTSPQFGWITGFLLKSISSLAKGLVAYQACFRNRKAILLMVIFRTIPSLLSFFFSKFSSYYSEKSIHYYYELEDRINNKAANIQRELGERILNQQKLKEQEEQEEDTSDSSYDEQSDSEIYDQKLKTRELEIQRISQQIEDEYNQENINIEKKHYIYNFYSNLLGIATYLVPSFFSFHRAYYCISNNRSYFSTPLLKCAFFDTLYFWGYDSFLPMLISKGSMFLQSQIFNSFEYIDKITKSFKNSTNNNNQNINNNNNNNNNNQSQLID